MKNILKKFVSSLLAFTVVFSLCGVANVFASENNIDDNFNPYSFPSNIELESRSANSGDIDELLIIEASSSEKVQARVDNDFGDRASSSAVTIMRIFAINDGGSSSFNTSGHAFLSIKNISSSTITVGGLSVSAGVPNTPTATVQSIKTYSNLYSTGVGIPYFGTVYYGNPPVASSVY